jgi:hypothetical protein
MFNIFKKSLKQIISSLFLIVYLMFNFINYADASICVSQNNISLNFFGVHNCNCIEKIHNDFGKQQDGLILNSTNQIIKHDCNDNDLYTNSFATVPDFYKNIDVLPQNYNIFIENLYQFLNNYKDTNNLYNNKYAFIDNRTLLSYKKIRLTI